MEIQHERTHWSRDTDLCFSRCLHWPAETELRGASVQQHLHAPPLHTLRLLFLLRAAEAGQRFAASSSHRDVFIPVLPTGQRVAAGRLRHGLGYLALMLHFKSQLNRVQDWVCVKTHLRTFCFCTVGVHWLRLYVILCLGKLTDGQTYRTIFCTNMSSEHLIWISFLHQLHFTSSMDTLNTLTLFKTFYNPQFQKRTGHLEVFSDVYWRRAGFILTKKVCMNVRCVF